VRFVFRLLSGSFAEGKAGPHGSPPTWGASFVSILPDRKQRYAVYPLSLVTPAYKPRFTYPREIHDSRVAAVAVLRAGPAQRVWACQMRQPGLQAAAVE